MSRQRFFSEIEQLNQHKDFEGLTVEERNNYELVITQFPDKLKNAQSATGVKQRLVSVVQKLTQLSQRYDLPFVVQYSKVDIDRIYQQIKQNHFALFHFNSSSPMPSLCSFTVTSEFLKGCRDYLHIDLRRAFTADLLRFEGKTLTLISEEGELLSCNDDQGESIKIENQTLYALMYVINKHCDTHYWVNNISLPIEIRLAMEQGAKRQLETIIKPLRDMPEITRLYQQSQFNVGLSVFCKAVISSINVIPSFNVLDDLRLDNNKQASIDAVNTALDCIGWEQSMLAQDFKSAVRLYQAWVELLAFKLSEYLDAYHSECFDKSMFIIQQYSKPKPKKR